MLDLMLFKKINWLHWVFVATSGLSLAVASRGYSLLAVRGLLIAVASPGAEHRPSGAQALVVAAQRLSCPVACGIFLHWGSNLCPLHW